jgi:hypothetical protein
MQSTLVKRKTAEKLSLECLSQETNCVMTRRRNMKRNSDSNTKPTVFIDNKVKIVLSPAPSIKNDSTRSSNNIDDEQKNHLVGRDSGVAIKKSLAS